MHQVYQWHCLWCHLLIDELTDAHILREENNTHQPLLFSWKDDYFQHMIALDTSRSKNTTLMWNLYPVAHELSLYFVLYHYATFYSTPFIQLRGENGVFVDFGNVTHCKCLYHCIIFHICITVK